MGLKINIEFKIRKSKTAALKKMHEYFHILIFYVSVTVL